MKTLVDPVDVWGLPPQADIDPKEDIPDYIYSEEEASRKIPNQEEHNLTQGMTVRVNLQLHSLKDQAN